jgi:hypothetical protein
MDLLTAAAPVRGLGEMRATKYARWHVQMLGRRQMTIAGES